MYDCLQMLFHKALLGGEGTVIKISMKCNQCYIFQTMSELSARLACFTLIDFAHAEQVFQI